MESCILFYTHHVHLLYMADPSANTCAFLFSLLTLTMLANDETDLFIDQIEKWTHVKSVRQKSQDYNEFWCSSEASATQEHDSYTLTLPAPCHPQEHSGSDVKSKMFSGGGSSKHYSTEMTGWGRRARKRNEEDDDGRDSQLFAVSSPAYSFKWLSARDFHSMTQQWQPESVISQWSHKCLFSPAIMGLHLSIQFAHKWNH